MRRFSGTKAMPSPRAAAVDLKDFCDSVEQEAALLDPGFPEQGPGQLDLAAAHETIDPGDFPGPQLERHIAELPAVADGFGGQHDGLAVIALEIGTFPHVHADRAAPDHVGDHRILGERGGGFGGNFLAVAEHRDRIGNFQHIVEEVRNEDDAAPIRLDLAQNVKQPLHLRRRQRRGGLIQDDDAGPGKQDARKFHKLLQADRQRTHPGLGIDIKAEAGDEPCRLLVDPGPVHRAHLGQRLVAQKNILGNREVRNGRQLLVHHADARRQRLARRAEMYFSAVNAHFAVIVVIDPGDDFHRGGFARPVFADQAVNFAGLQRHIDILQRRDAAE